MWVAESTATVWELGPTSASPILARVPWYDLKSDTPPDSLWSNKDGVKPVSLGADWKGAAPEFRNLRWLGGDHLN